MKQLFVPKRFSTSSLEMIERIQVILNEYQTNGYDLSLRQLYYQLVARDIIENSDKSYKRIGSLLNDARLAGLVDWSMIKDRGRVPVQNSHWDNPGEIISSAAYSFKLDRWSNQPTYVELMVEKQALEGVLIPVCRNLDIMFTSNKGYSSTSALYQAGRRMHYALRGGKDVKVLYLGDHDPSGIDMTRDVEERLKLFAEYEEGEGSIEVQRLALNFDQVEGLNPPPNPAKESDARFESYAAVYGETCWELDAIEPRSLARIVEDSVFNFRDADLLNDLVEEEKDKKDLLSKAADHWNEVEKFLEEL